MKLSPCHSVRVIKHPITKQYICKQCGFAGFVEKDKSEEKKYKIAFHPQELFTNHTGYEG